MQIAGKRDILSALDEELPENATLKDALDYIYYLYSIEQAIDEADAHPEQMVPHEEIVRKIEQWIE
ncbi:MAG: hypothetical protein ABIP58_03440 [Dehalococcoidia bacterium]